MVETYVVKPDKLGARALGEYVELAKKYGYWTHLKDSPIIKIEELPK